MTTTQIHDSTTCTAGLNGQKCLMCQFAEKAAQRAEHEEIVLLEAKNVSQVKYDAGITLPRFEQAWNSLPRDIRRVTELEAGELIYRLGVRDGRLLEQVETNRVMREMAGKLEEIR